MMFARCFLPVRMGLCFDLMDQAGCRQVLHVASVMTEVKLWI